MRWSILLLSSMLALLAGFVLGYDWHRRTHSQAPPPASTLTPESTAPPILEAVVEPDKPIPSPEQIEPIPIKVKPFIEQPVEDSAVDPKPEPAPEPEPEKISAAAEATLHAFLGAPDWAARSAYVLFPDKVRPAMEAYSRVVPDGPTPFKSISVQHSHLDEKTGYTLFVFFVKTEKFPDGIPVAVQETQMGWLIDWQAFVEFRDEHFQKFVTGPIHQTGRFHLIVNRPTPERAAKNDNQHFSSLSVRSPMSPTQQIAYVAKTTEAFATIEAATENGTPLSAVLEITKRNTKEGKTYLEVVNLIATDWLPSETPN